MLMSNNKDKHNSKEVEYTPESYSVEVYDWERQEQLRETLNCYRLFEFYKDQPAHTRTLRKASVLSGKKLSYISFLSSKFDWVRRAKAYDDFLSDQRMQHRIALAREFEDESYRQGVELQEIGMRSIRGKDVDSISTKDALGLVNSGGEFVRKSLYKDEERDRVSVSVDLDGLFGIISSRISALQDSTNSSKSGEDSDDEDSVIEDAIIVEEEE